MGASRARGEVGTETPETPAETGATETGATEPEGVAPGPVGGDLGPIRLPDRFRPSRILGRGGMGVVVAAHDDALGREVAVKVMRHADPQRLTRFLREARTAGTLRHPNLVTIHDVNVEHGFIVMERIEGESLREIVRRDGALPPDRVRSIGLDVLGALGAAHAAGIVHRDVKPGNVLVAKDGTAKLVDFGIAAFGDSELTTPGQQIGTPAYMSPEQLRGRAVDHRSDLYSLGATLFEAATGTRLHGPDGRADDPIRAVRAATGDRGLAAAIAAAVADRASDRHPDASAFARALRRHAPGSSPRRRRLLGAVVLSGVALAGLGVLAVRRGHEHAVTQSDAPRVAILPLRRRVGDDDALPSAAVLEDVMRAELHEHEHLSVLGVEQLRSRVTSDDAPRAEWMRAARSLGATKLVLAEVSGDANELSVRAWAETPDGEVLGVASRRTEADGLAVALATAVREAVDTERGTEQQDADRAIHVAEQLVAEHRLEEAEAQLHAILAEHPQDARAHHQLAVVSWWRGLPTEQTLLSIEAALAGDLGDPERRFLVGLDHLVQQRYPEAIRHFERAHRRYNTDRDLLYGYFEALFHGGYPGRAMLIHGRLAEAYPDFRLGLTHVLQYHLAHGNWESAEWAVRRSNAFGDTGTLLWEPRLARARGRYDDALAMLRARAETNDGALDGEIEADLIRTLAVAGRIPDAVAIAERRAAAEGPGTVSRLAMFGLAVAQGDVAGRDRWREAMLEGLEARAAGRSRLVPLSSFMLIGLGDPEATSLEAGDLRELHSRAVTPDRAGRLETRLFEVLLAGVLDDQAHVEAATGSSFPEVAAAASALRAEREQDWDAAARQWRRAAGFSADGQFRGIALYRLAKTERALGRHEAVVAACEEVIVPGVFVWSWASTAPRCLSWSAEAHLAMGRRTEAQAAVDRLLRIRSTAPRSDPILREARTLLRRSR